jgi:hypothetical protein
MTERTLTVAANGYTRDQIALTLNGGRYADITWMPIAVVYEIETDLGIVRFVTDNDLDDGVFRVVGEE